MQRTSMSGSYVLSSSSRKTAPGAGQIRGALQGLLFPCSGTGTQHLFGAAVEEVTFRGRVLGKLPSPTE